MPPARLTVDELGNNGKAHCFSLTRLTAKESLDGQNALPLVDRYMNCLEFLLSSENRASESSGTDCLPKSSLDREES